MKNLLFLLLALSVCCSLGMITSDVYAQTKGEICDNGKDDDDDKLVDCDDPDCKCPPPPPPDGTPCSPGYWKNHESDFNQYCAAAAAIPGDRFETCDDLWTALNCKGNNESCGRSAAAAALNAVSGCTED